MITIYEYVNHFQPITAMLLAVMALPAKEPEQHRFEWWKREMETVPGYDKDTG